MKLKNWILKHKVITAIIAVILVAVIGVGIYSINHPIVIYLGLEPTPSSAEPSATPTATPTPTPAPTPEATAPPTPEAVSSGVPCGTYSTVDIDGTTYYLTIDSNGSAVIKGETSRGTISMSYQGHIDETVTPQNGKIAYLLESTSSAPNRAMYYDIAGDTLTEAANLDNVWTRVE